jgi:hypothetical protein
MAVSRLSAWRAGRDAFGRNVVANSVAPTAKQAGEPDSR